MSILHKSSIGNAPTIDTNTFDLAETRNAEMHHNTTGLTASPISSREGYRMPATHMYRDEKKKIMLNRN